MSIMFSRSSSVSLGGDSVAIFIKQERVFSPMRFLRRVLMSFISEKLRSTEAVATGIDKHTLILIVYSGSGT